VNCIPVPPAPSPTGIESSPQPRPSKRSRPSINAGEASGLPSTVQWSESFRSKNKLCFLSGQNAYRPSAQIPPTFTRLSESNNQVSIEKRTAMCPLALADAANSSALDRPLSRDEVRQMDAYWRAANYLSVGQIYLLENPLLREPLKVEHVKPRLLGHWGTTPGLNFIYVHCNRIIKKYGLNVINITGPGHGGPGIVANNYLEGTYTEFYLDFQQNEDGIRKLFKQFSFPGGIPSHCAPETPGSINEGGELGYSIAHAYGAVFDNPDLLACCVVGDGEAETARWRPVGIPTSFSTRREMGQYCPFCI